MYSPVQCYFIPLQYSVYICGRIVSQCVCLEGHFEGEEGREMKRSVFETLSGVLQTALQDGDSEHSAVTLRQLQTLARATWEVVEVSRCGIFHVKFLWTVPSTNRACLPQVVSNCMSLQGSIISHS